MAEKGIRKWIVTITVIMASLLELIDTTIVNVSLPDIMGNLGATLDEVGWVVTAYAISNVVILPMSGWLGERFGRKNYFLFSIIVFTIASFFCGHATSLNELILFRIIQGLAGGGLLSTAQAILLEAWPPEEIGLATALFGLGAVVGPTVGPTIGGYINDHFSWPWIFYVNIPVGALASFLVVTFIRPTPAHGKNRPVDWWGIVLLAIAVGCLQTVLEKGEREDWFASTFIVVLTFISIVSGILFIWREMQVADPVIDFRILRYRSFTIGMFTSFILGLGLYGSVFVFPYFVPEYPWIYGRTNGVTVIARWTGYYFHDALGRGHAQKQCTGAVSRHGRFSDFLFILHANGALHHTGIGNCGFLLAVDYSRTGHESVVRTHHHAGRARTQRQRYRSGYRIE